MFWWIFEHWLLVAYAAAILVSWSLGGWRLALGVATFGGGVLMYRQGHKDAERAIKVREEERQDAYRKIDERGTTGSDVVERLRRSDY